MSIRKRDVHFSDWTKVRHALVCNNVQGITETSSFDEVRTFLINSESGSNPFYYYVCYIKETKEIYTHGQFYAYSDSSYDDTELRNLIGTKADLSALEALVSEVAENELVTAKALYDLNDRKLDKSELDNIDLSNYVDLETYNSDLDSINASITNKANQSDLEALSAEVEENEEVTAAALTELHENKADKSEIPDVSTFATNTDLNTKQDLLVSGTNIKTVNGDSILGSGNIEITDTKVTSAENHYGYNSDNATSTTGAFVTKITKDAANHVTSFESRALTSTDIPGLDASKITSGTIDIARLPKGALEQLHHYETKELAQQAVIDKAVQLGDTVQINNATMYICTNDSATTFATQFTEYVAGTAASVPWSGITGKPDLATQEELDVVDAKFSNYLPLTGGTVNGSITLNNPTSDTLFEGAITLDAKSYGSESYSQIRFKNGSDVSTRYGFINLKGSAYGHGSGVEIGRRNDNSTTIWASIDANGITATSFIGNLTGNADTATTATSATKLGSYSINSFMTFSDYTDYVGARFPGSKLTQLAVDKYIEFWSSPGWYNSAWGKVTAHGGFTGNLTGNVTGNADSATTIYLGNSNANGAFPVPFVSNATVGNKSLFVSTTNTLIFNPSTGGLSAKNFIGDLTGTASGNLPLTGGTITGALTLGGTTSATAAIKFSRSGDNAWNYIIWPGSTSSDCKLAFGYDTNAQSSFYYMTSNAFYPTVTNTYSLGTSDLKWSNVYSTTFTGNLAGNADTANVISNTYLDESINYDRAESKIRLIAGKSANSEELGYPRRYSTGLSVVSSYAGWQMVCYGSHTNYHPYYRSVSDTNVWGEWEQIAFTSDIPSLSGYATTAQLGNYLPKAGGALTGPLKIESENWGAQLNLNRLNNGDSWGPTIRFYADASGLGAITMQDNELYVSDIAGNSRTAVSKVGHTHDYLSLSGGALTGAVTSTSTFSATDFITTSDNRLKDFTKDVIVDFNELKNIPKKYYYWKDKSMGEELQIGTSAQELAKVYPECVSYNEKEDRYSVNYQKLSIIALAAIDKLHERISVLEKKLNDQNS